MANLRTVRGTVLLGSSTWDLPRGIPGAPRSPSGSPSTPNT